MKSKSQRIIIIIFATIVLPMVSYVLYEVSTLNENEELIEDIYKNQLETMIFSVNQYSNDFISALMNRVEEDFDVETGALSEETLQLIANDGFQVFSVSPLYGSEFYHVNMTEVDIHDQVEWVKRNNQKLIGQLADYLSSGYRKLEPSGMIELEGAMYQILLAMISKQGNVYVCIGLIDPVSFTEEILSPKMQQIANEDMVITMQNKHDESILYTTDSLTNNVLVTGSMWLFPEMLIGVSPNSVTVADLVDERLRNNLLALGVLVALLAVGFTLVIRNVNREMVLSQNKSEFVSNVSHELRTPLALISMFAETLLLERVKSKEKAHEYIEIIFKETNRLTGIVSRILNFSRIEAGRRSYHFGQVDINQLLQEVCRDYSYHLDQNGFTHELVTSDEEIRLTADKDAIYEAVVNLIDNAIKYSDENKSVTLISGSSGEKAWIKVQDSGVGIPKERLEFIFDKFYRVSENNIYTTLGTGLGLTIVKHIMDAHHGTINVSSDLGKGSTFELIFNKNFDNG